MTSVRFGYAPLDAATRNIRLLRFKRQRSNGLELILETYDVGACPEFVALSYVWGPEDPSYIVSLDGREFSIRHNLWLLLRRLDFGALREKYFWIDAICIDQGNPQERGHQVNLMKDIFSTSNLTIAWIGRSNKDSDFVIDRCVNRKHVSSLELFKAALAAENLLRRPYFERMWIVQEVLLSRRLLIFCGMKECWWEDFNALLYDRRWRFEIDIPDGVDALFRARGARRGMPMALHRLLYDFHTKKCSDIRDRVYALLGLATEENQTETLQADYTISPQVLYYRTLLYFSNSFALRGDPGYAAVVEEKLAVALELDKNLAAAIHQRVHNETANTWRKNSADKHKRRKREQTNARHSPYPATIPLVCSQSTPSLPIERPPVVDGQDRDQAKRKVPLRRNRTSSESGISTKNKSNVATKRSSSTIGTDGGHRCNLQGSHNPEYTPNRKDSIPSKHSLYGASTSTSLQSKISPPEITERKQLAACSNISTDEEPLTRKNEDLIDIFTNDESLSCEPTEKFTAPSHIANALSAVLHAGINSCVLFVETSLEALEQLLD